MSPAFFNQMLKDLSMKYSGVYGYLIDTKQWIEVSEFKSNLDEAGGTQILVSYCGADGKTELCSLSRFNFVSEIPESRAYNWRKGVVYLLRMPTRQNLRGMCSGTVTLFNPMYSLWNCVHHAIGLHLPKGVLDTFSGPPSSRAYQEMFEGSSVPDDFETALSKVRSEKFFARILSPTMYLTCGLETPDPVVWCRKAPIGEVKNDRIIGVNPLHQLELSRIVPPGIDLICQ